MARIIETIPTKEDQAACTGCRKTVAYVPNEGGRDERTEHARRSAAR